MRDCANIMNKPNLITACYTLLLCSTGAYTTFKQGKMPGENTLRGPITVVVLCIAASYIFRVGMFKEAVRLGMENNWFVPIHMCTCVMQLHQATL